jgi:hypothetical protein
MKVFRKMSGFADSHTRLFCLCCRKSIRQNRILRVVLSPEFRQTIFPLIEVSGLEQHLINCIASGLGGRNALFCKNIAPRLWCTRCGVTRRCALCPGRGRSCTTGRARKRIPCANATNHITCLGGLEAGYGPTQGRFAATHTGFHRPAVDVREPDRLGSDGDCGGWLEG